MRALVPQLKEYLTVLDSRKRMFLISWITVLASVPDIDMLAFLPALLGGLMDALQDEWREVGTASTKALQVRLRLGRAALCRARALLLPTSRLAGDRRPGSALPAACTALACRQLWRPVRACARALVTQLG